MTDSTLHIGERKWELETARRIVTELADQLRPACERLEVGGSIRRGSPMVKDAELIAMPGARHPVPLLDLTDDLVAQGVVEKALYPWKDKHITKWGTLYRGMLFQGMKVELFLADEINWGYQKWLRTGPGTANHYIMAQLIHKRAALRFVDGYGWYSPGNLWAKQKDKWVAADKVRLNIPDEDTLFALLGMPFLPPNERTEQRYKQLIQWNRQHAWPDFKPFVIADAAPQQVTFKFFGDSLIDMENRHLKDSADTVSLSPYMMTSERLPAWNAHIYSSAVRRAERQLEFFRIQGLTYSSYANRALAMEREIVTLRELAAAAGVRV